MSTYDGMDPDAYAAELIAMGASAAEAAAAAEDLRRRQNG